MKGSGLLLFAVIQSIAISLHAQSPNGYTIKGSATGFPDSTLLYLDDLTDGSFKHIDSTWIMHETFGFTGAVKAGPIHAAIRTKDFSNRCYIWLENGAIDFRAEKGKFKQALVTGTQLQAEQDALSRVLDTSQNRKQQEYMFVKNHPGSLISASMLSVHSTGWGRDSTEKLYTPFTPQIKDSYYGRAIADYLAVNKNLHVGDSYVDFAQENTGAITTRLSELKGKLVLLEFWGSWCGPCRQGNPELVRIYQEYHPKGFDILGVAAETSREPWLAAIKQDGLPWPNVTDLKGDKNQAALIYGVSYYPTNFLINSKGIIIARDVSGEVLRGKLRELLNNN